MTTITREQAQKIIDAADEVITALAGTNDDFHPDNSTKMVQLYDDLNDRYAPPEVVRELARAMLVSMDAEPVAWECGENIILFNPDTVEAYAKRAEISPKPLYATPPVQETGVYKDMLNIIGLLENNEWAEHCASTVLGSLLESEITRLVGKEQLMSVVPETLPCPVHLVPGLRLGKGCKTETLLIALQRRAEYYAGLDAMTPEERAKHYANIEAFKAMLPQPAPVAPEDLRRSFEAVARLNNEMYRWTSCMSYNGSYVGEPEGLLKRNIREIERILDSCKSDKGE